MGDFQGHPFRGNQWRDAAENAAAKEKQSARLSKLGYEKLASGRTPGGIEYEIHGGRPDSDVSGNYLVLNLLDYEEIGRAIVSKYGAGEYVSSARVEPERQGIGTKLYDTIEKHLGRKLKPSHTLSPKAQEFWNKRDWTRNPARLV